MHNEKKAMVFLLIIFAAIVFLSFHPTLTGSSINEGQGRYEVSILNALAGTTVERSLNIQINSEQLVHQEMAVSGEAKEWIGFVQTEYLVPPSIEYEIPFFITIPEGTEPGEYDATIILLSVQEFDDGSVLSDEIIEYFDVKIQVGEEESKGVSLQNLIVYTSEKGENIFFESDIQNEGNRETEKEVIFRILQDEEVLATETYDVSFYAQEYKTVSGQINTELNEGLYNVEVIMDNVKIVEDLKVVGEGELKKEGSILFSSVESSNSGLLTINTYFKNNGEGVIDSTMLGTILSEDQEIATFAVEVEGILPQDYAILTYSLTPKVQYSQYNYDLEIVSENVVLDKTDGTAYRKNAVALSSSFYVVFTLIMLLLFISHYLLSKRTRGEDHDE
jgi:hypothetical protein